MVDSDAPKRTDSDSERLKAVHKRAMERFDECATATLDNRAISLASRRFISITGAQWEGWAGEQFANSIMIEASKVGRGVRKLETDYRDNRIIPDYRPDGDNANQETADTLDGMHRADSYRFKSQQARDNAFSEAAAGGFGAYRASNEYEDESDRDNDRQRVNPASIIGDADQCVFFDLNAKLYDKSDARFAFIRVAMTVDAFKEEYGPERHTDFPSPAAWKMLDWFTPETAAVAEYYEKEEAKETLWVLTYTLSGEQRRIWSSELADGELADLKADGWQAVSQRRKRFRVHKYILSGAEVLEDCGFIAGPNIPIVPVYGLRWFVDGVERWQGYVTDKMDRARVYNMMVSRLAETSSQSAQETPIFDPEQMPPGPIQDVWARRNVDRPAYLLAHSLRNEDGSIAVTGPVGTLSPPTLSQVDAALLQIVNQDLLEEMEDGADEVRANTSADAMDIAASRVDAKSGIYLDNMRQSVQREGEIYAGMCAEVYFEPGREVDTMGEDGDDGKATLKQPKTDDLGRHYIANDLQSGRYRVIASVTEATATRRDKTVRSAMRLAEVANAAGDTELGRVSLLTAVMNQDGEGMADMQAYARKQLVGMGVVPPNEDEKRAMDEAAQNQQPDPLTELASAQAREADASAGLKVAQTGKAEADAGLSEAKTIETLVKAHANENGPERGTAERPMIRRGNEIAA